MNLRQRATHHRRANSGVTYLYRAIRKHGIDAFDICVYATGTEAEMTALEVEVIAARGTFNPAGYNQTRGGDGSAGWKAPAEWRAAVSARVKGVPLKEETRQKMSAARLAHNPFKGKKHTPEAIARISAALTGRVVSLSSEGKAAIAASNARKKGTKWVAGHSDEAKKKISAAKLGVRRPDGFGAKMSKGVLMWAPGSLTPMTFASGKEAAAYLGCGKASISNWCQGRQTPSNGAVFAYEK